MTEIVRTITLGVRLNHLIWTTYFDQAWERIPFAEKLIWIMFVSHTMGILTILLFLSK